MSNGRMHWVWVANKSVTRQGKVSKGWICIRYGYKVSKKKRQKVLRRCCVIQYRKRPFDFRKEMLI